MKNVISWVRANPLPALLICMLLVLFFWQQSPRFSLPMSTGSLNTVSYDYYESDMAEIENGMPMGKQSMGISRPSTFAPEVAPSIAQDRMVVQNTSLSMLTKDVSKTIADIQQLAKQMGGFMVNSYVNHPEGASSGNITVRVPSATLESTLKQVRSLGVRVTHENVSGVDITDQYEDLQAQLQILENTKVKFQDIFNQATEVSDLLNIQQQLSSLQQQIDSLKGQQLYLERTSELSLVTISLSTDELALPYAPDQVWRPAVVFKQAVRSLITSLRSVGNNAIWIAVYAVIWVPIGVIAFVSWKFFSKLKKV